MQRSFELAHAALLAASLLAATPVSAQTLDAGFGIGGKVITSFNGLSDSATAIAVQPDGRIVAAGFTTSTSAGNADFALARYNGNGTLDGGFGIGGRVVTDFGTPADFALAVAVQADGRILAGGYVNGNFGLARYNNNGSLDATFGTGGRVTTGFGGTTQGIASVALQPDGKIVAAGAVNLDGTFQFALARYNSNGSLDQTFGKGGKVAGNDFDLVGQGFSFALAYAVAVQPDGKIVAAGEAHINGSFDFAVARYDSSGSPDPDFGTAGKATLDVSAARLTDRARAVVVQPDGKILVTGGALISTATNTSFNFALVRYDDDGTLDRGFGTNGVVATDFVGFSDFAHSVAIRPDGKIVAAGQAAVASASDVAFAMVRYNVDGTRDLSFGLAGRAIVDFALSADLARAVAVQPDGKVVAAGTAVVNGAARFCLARFR